MTAPRKGKPRGRSGGRRTVSPDGAGTDVTLRLAPPDLRTLDMVREARGESRGACAGRLLRHVLRLSRLGDVLVTLPEQPPEVEERIRRAADEA